jgi:hypothetical protein
VQQLPTLFFQLGNASLGERVLPVTDARYRKRAMRFPIALALMLPLLPGCTDRKQTSFDECRRIFVKPCPRRNIKRSGRSTKWTS